jgi:uncharacterized protein YbjT (DUF2867 family)
VDTAFIVPPGTTAEERVSVACNYVRAAAEAKVKYVAVVSGLTASDDLYTRSSFGAQFRQIEQACIASHMSYAFLRCPFFLENLYGHIGSISVRRLAHTLARALFLSRSRPTECLCACVPSICAAVPPSFTAALMHACLLLSLVVPVLQAMGLMFAPVSPTTPYVAIATDDIGRAAAVCCAEPAKHMNKAYALATSEACTHRDLAALFSRESGKEVKFMQASEEQAVKGMTDAGMPQWLIQGVTELWRLVEDGAMPVTSDFKAITGTRSDGMIR